MLLVHQVLPPVGGGTGDYGLDSGVMRKTRNVAKQDLVNFLGHGCALVLDSLEKSEPVVADFPDQHFWLQAEAAELLSAV